MSIDKNRNIYKGHRYVPLIDGEWDKNKSYEGLTVVTHQGTSYTSKKHVPVGIDILNTDYWVVTGNYNAQIEHYRQEVRDMQEQVDSKASKEDVLDLQDQVDSKADTDYVINEINNVNNEIDNVHQQLTQKVNMVKENMEFTIGETGDFNTLNEALEHLSEYKNTFTNTPHEVILRYLPGYRVTEQTTLKDIDLSFITITSTNNEEIPVTVNGNIIRCYNSKAPNINLIYDMEKNGATGIHLESGSSIFVHPDCGVKNAGLHGIHFIQSSGTILKTVFTGSLGCGVRLTQSSNVTAMGADASYSGLDGFFVTRTSLLHINELDDRKSKATNCGGAGINCSAARVSANGAILTHNNRGIIVANGGVVSGLDSVDCSYSELDGVLAEGGEANLPYIVADFCGQYGLQARYGGKIFAREGHTEGCQMGLFLRHGAFIMFDGGTSINHDSRSIIARDGSIVSAFNTTCDNGVDNIYSVEARAGSTINLQASIARGITVSRGSTVNAHQTDCRMVEGVDGGANDPDIQVQFGGIVAGNETLGNLSQEENLITENGIIFREVRTENNNTDE